MVVLATDALSSNEEKRRALGFQLLADLIRENYGVVEATVHARAQWSRDYMRVVELFKTLVIQGHGVSTVIATAQSCLLGKNNHRGERGSGKATLILSGARTWFQRSHLCCSK
jgi:hypothetical protein